MINEHKMKSKTIIYPILIILLASIAFAEDRHYELMLSYDFINDTVELKHIYSVGGEARPEEGVGDYRYELKSFDNKILSTFNFHMSANNRLVILRTPYFKNGKTINVYDKSNKKLLDIDVGYFADVCGDNECQSHENYGICPQDCPSGSKDNYCDQLSDGICDKDCLTGDYDCETKKTTLLFLSAGVALLIIILVMVMLRLMPVKRKRYEITLELKNYMITSLRRGYSKQQIASELKKDGWPDDLIKEAFKSIKPAHTTKEELLELHNYILNTEKMGYSDAQIKRELLKEGWSKEAVELAFKTTEKPEETPKEEILQLQNYIENTLAKGYTQEQIMFVLKKEGWPEKTLNSIFDGLEYSTFAKK